MHLEHVVSTKERRRRKRGIRLENGRKLQQQSKTMFFAQKLTNRKKKSAESPERKKRFSVDGKG